MVSLVARRAQSSAAAAVSLLALLAFLLTDRSTAAESLGDDARLLNQVQEILSQDGPFSSRLLEPLTTLGLLYQESDDLVLAVATLERAVQIVRINRGLHTLAQVPLTRELIRLEEALGNDERAWQREQKLLTLLRRHLDDLETVPVLSAIADKQMEVLAAVLAGRRPPQVLLGCFYQEWPGKDGGDCTSGSRTTVIQGMLAEAQRNYADAIGILLQHGLYGSDELRDLELKVLRGVDLLRARNDDPGSGYPVPMIPPYFNTSSIEPWRSRIAPLAALADWQPPQGRVLDEREAQGIGTKQVEMMSPYQRGRQSLERLYAYTAASSSPSLSQAHAIVQLADWDLLYSHNGRAIESYAAAYAMLERAGTEQASIAQLFAPDMPVVLPAFQPNPLRRDEARLPTGHIDVAFEITQYGRGRGVEVRDAANVSDEERQQLVSLIKSNRFRPRVTDGRLAAATPVALRYYVYD